MRHEPGAHASKYSIPHGRSMQDLIYHTFIICSISLVSTCPELSASNVLNVSLSFFSSSIFASSESPIVWRAALRGDLVKSFGAMEGAKRLQKPRRLLAGHERSATVGKLLARSHPLASRHDVT